MCILHFHFGLHSTGSTEWIQDPHSMDYDWKLLQKRIDEINHVRQFDNDRKSMIFTLKLSLSRNLGDMGNATVNN